MAVGRLELGADRDLGKPTVLVVDGVAGEGLSPSSRPVRWDDHSYFGEHVTHGQIYHDGTSGKGRQIAPTRLYRERTARRWRSDRPIPPTQQLELERRPAGESAHPLWLHRIRHSTHESHCFRWEVSPMQASAVTDQHHRLSANGVSLHYAESGVGRPAVVFLHGIGTDWRVWSNQARRLAPYFRLLMLDLRGHGASDHPDRGYNLSDYAADVVALTDRLGWRQPNVIGHSLGGYITARLAADHPDRRPHAPPDPVAVCRGKR